MVGKKSGRALLREEGLQRTDNNMEFTNWPQAQMINQKNYYTEFLKRDDQILALRLQQEERLDQRKRAAVDLDRSRAANGQEGAYPDGPEAEMDDDAQMDDPGNENYGSKTIVFHIGSQNLRLGLATDALPKTVPMVIARPAEQTEAEDSEPCPKRIRLDRDAPSEEWFGEEFAKEYSSMAADFKIYRRQNKRRVLPNSRELVTKWNSTNPPERISEHNDPLRVDWTTLPSKSEWAPNYIVGNKALRLPETTKPKYKLRWPVRHGWLNEKDYISRTVLMADFFLIIADSIRNELGIHDMDRHQYGCVFIIPDLYEKVLVADILGELIGDFRFAKVCFIQESLAATFGAGFGAGCIVDMGAQKTSICCVEDGMCLEESRINMKYGGFDVTETFVKMMLFDRFNYSDFNLMRRHDFLLAEELKEQFTTMSDENIVVQTQNFHLRVFGQETRKYQFKIYDEGMLAPMGFFRPAIFDNASKLIGRRRLIPRSVDLYDGRPNDPVSEAQLAVISYVDKNLPSAVIAEDTRTARSVMPTPIAPTPIKQRPLGHLAHLNNEIEGTPRSSVAGSPAPDDFGTPMAVGDATIGDITINDIQGPQPDIDIIDRTLPVMPLEQAILTSINLASGTDERKRRDFLGSIMLIGGASKTPDLGAYLEMRLRAAMPQYPKEILVVPPPRELDPAVLVWKGGSVFGKLRTTNDSWITPLEYDRLGARILNYKCMWHW